MFPNWKILINSTTENSISLVCEAVVSATQDFFYTYVKDRGRQGKD